MIPKVQAQTFQMGELDVLLYDLDVWVDSHVEISAL